MMPVGSISYIVITGLEELLAAAVLYVALFLLVLARQKMPSGVSFALALLSALPPVMYIILFRTKTQVVIFILSALLCVLTLHLSRLVSLSPAEGISLFPFFLIPECVFNSANTLFGPGIQFLFLFLAIFGWAKIKYKSLRGRFLRFYISFIYLALVFFVFTRFSFQIYDLFLHRPNGGNLLLLAAIPGLFLTLCLLTAFAGKRLSGHLFALKLWTSRYLRTEKHVYFLTVFTVAVLLASHIPFVLTRTSSTVLQNVMPVFYLILLVFQILFIVLLYQNDYYRDVLRFKEQEYRQEQDYGQSLQKNLASMADLRHDIKNIFLTMGRFVERSSDQEMKDFYSEKIFPFAMEEIEKNYLFSQLYQIPDETLRAFLHMKFSQAHNLSEHIRLKILLEANSFHLGMDIIDLTRILGILLDNAFEECARLQGGSVEVQIRSNQELCTYTIKNPRLNTPDGGIQGRGFTTKSGHTGLGLSIVRSIVQLYPHVTLNTFSDSQCYIQSLHIRTKIE